MTGANRVAKATPDGYTFLLGGSATMTTVPALYGKKTLYNPLTDFEHVIQFADSARILIARKDFPANSLKEFVAYAKANHDKMQYGSVRHRRGRAYLRAAARSGDGREDHARALSRLRPGDAGPARRTHRLHLRAGLDRGAADQGRHREADRHDGPEPLRRAARPEDRRRRRASTSTAPRSARSNFPRARPTRSCDASPRRPTRWSRAPSCASGSRRSASRSSRRSGARANIICKSLPPEVETAGAGDEGGGLTRRLSAAARALMMSDVPRIVLLVLTHSAFADAAEAAPARAADARRARRGDAGRRAARAGGRLAARDSRLQGQRDRRLSVLDPRCGARVRLFERAVRRDRGRRPRRPHHRRQGRVPRRAVRQSNDRDPPAAARHVPGARGRHLDPRRRACRRCTRISSPARPITARAMRGAVADAARLVLRARVAVPQVSEPTLNREQYRRVTWDELLAEGAVVRRRITSGEVAAALGTQRREAAHRPTARVRRPLRGAAHARRDRRQPDRAQSLQRVHAALSGRRAGDRGRVVRSVRFPRRRLRARGQGLSLRPHPRRRRTSRSYHFVNADFLRLDTRAHEGFLAQQYAALFALPPTFDPLKEWRLELLVRARRQGGRHFRCSTGCPRAYVLVPEAAAGAGLGRGLARRARRTSRSLAPC